MNRILSLSIAAITALALASCGVVKNAGDTTASLAKKSASAVGKTAQATTKGVSNGVSSIATKAKDLPKPSFGLAKLFGRGSDVPIVAVRKDSLKDMPTGKEKALAYEREQEQLAKLAGANTTFDYTEPSLPSNNGEYQGGLLPSPEEMDAN